MLTVRELKDILEDILDHNRIVIKVDCVYYEVTDAWCTEKGLIIESR